MPALRREIRATAPDLVISFGDEINVLVLLVMFPGTKSVVVTEHVDPRWHRIALHLRALRRLLYPRAFALVSVSRGVDSCFSWLPERRRSVIHNPVIVGNSRIRKIPRRGQHWEGNYILAMGRLIAQKGFDLLLSAFAEVDEKFADWRLLILGGGPERAVLSRQCEELEIADRVEIFGPVRDPFPHLADASFFVMSSRFEGFGNVLIEAMSCGLPVVSFDCPSGPSEIIQDKVNGILVPPQDVKALARAMEELMGDRERRREMSRNALVSAERFALDAIVQQWEQEVLCRAGRSA